MIKERIRKIIKKAIFKSFGKELSKIKIPVNFSQYDKFGDFSSPVSFQISKKLKKTPKKTAEIIIENIKKTKNHDIFQKIENRNGFINFFFHKRFLQKELLKIDKITQKKYLRNKDKTKKINIEFVSANPTGPLSLGNARGGFLGDALANILERIGFKVTREYYVNDKGEQIIALGHSVLGHKNAVYKGEYIKKLKKEIKEKDPEKVGKIASKIILAKMIKPTLKRAGIKFDIFFFESKLYQQNEVKKVLQKLKKKDFIYEKEGATWFKSKKFQDDKDRILIKKTKEPTYFLSDIAYLENKIKRGFNQLIFLWGADHAGYVKRIKGAFKALGYDERQLKIIIFQLVRLVKDGKKIRMSKRKGNIVTLDELLNEIDLDVARFFFLMKTPELHLDFDLEKAKEKSEKNPVYYIQYALARICSILRKSKKELKKQGLSVILKTKSLSKFLSYLEEPAELDLIKEIIKFPDILIDTSEDFQVQRICRYALSLAEKFHRFYKNCKVLVSNKELMISRIYLITITKNVLKETLKLLGISTPSKM